MGAKFNLLVLVWLVVIAVSASRYAYWAGVSEDLYEFKFSGPPEDMAFTQDELDTLNEADRMAGLWGIGGFTFGYFGFFHLFALWIKEDIQDMTDEGKHRGLVRG